MRKIVILVLALCLLLVGCGGSKSETQQNGTENVADDVVKPAVDGNTINPLPDSTMDNLADAILSVSFEKGDVSVDDTGKMQMKVKIYTYDLYDAIDIAQLKVGDTFAAHAGEIEVAELEKLANGNICVNGGLEKGGFELTPGDGGIFYEIGFNDAKNWYEVGETTIRVSADFEGHDNADPAKGEVIIYPGDFLVDDVMDYNFTPLNTTIRVEAGEVVELNRIYNP